MTFITDADARAPSGSHALAHLWDNGATAANALTSILAVRQRALDQFSVDQIPKGRPYSELEDVFVPMYLLHRYQTEAAVKLIGGTLYDYQVKGGVSFDDRYWLSVMAYFEAHPDKFEPVIVPKIPDGSPIGQNFCTTSAW